jgi:hypothetical protein
MTTPPRPTDFPRTYRLSAGWRWFSIIGGAAMTAAFIGFPFLFRGDANAPATAFPVAVGCSLLMVGFGAYLFACGFGSKLVLTADSIAVLDPVLPTRSLQRDEIAGTRIKRRPRGPSSLMLMPNRIGGKPVEIPNGVFDTDDVLTTWLTGLPDLDAAEEQASVEAIASDPALGPTRDVRLARLEAAIRLAKGAQWAVFGAVAACLFLPKPPGILLVILGAMPFAAIWWASRSGGLYRLMFKRNAEYGDLSPFVNLPGLGLMIVATRGDFHLEDVRQGMLAAALVTAALLVAIASAEPEARKLSMANVLQAIFLFAYGYGAFALADAGLDRSTPRVYRVVVEDQHVSRGRRSSTSYLELAPWGPRVAAEDATVPTPVYLAVGRGDTVCVSLRPGAVWVPWYSVDLCP